MRTLTGILYRNLVKPILFLFSADGVHSFFTDTGEIAGTSGILRGLTRAFWNYENPALSQVIHGITFKNPIGLSAGFDYDAHLIGILPAVGFGFHAVGTVSNGSYEGNPRPMLGRLPKSRSLLVNKGFKSAGMDEVLRRIPEAKKYAGSHAIPLAMSIGATNRSYAHFPAMADDIKESFAKAKDVREIDYFELNISCPNLINIKDFTERFDTPGGLQAILERLATLSLAKPVFIKMPLEKSIDETRALIETAKPFPFVNGLIFANLAKDRSNPALDKDEVARAGKGNFSGKPTEAKSNELITFSYRNYKDRFTIVGCGGVFTAEDAYKKIKLGAALIQMITGMIYMGPQQIGVINEGIAGFLKRDGYKNIAEAVGVENKS